MKSTMVSGKQYLNPEKKLISVPTVPKEPKSGIDYINKSLAFSILSPVEFPEK